MHNYAALSDHDFELMAASLLSAELGGVWEAFARGGDGGVDVRRTTPHLDIAQCKHMLGSTFAQLSAEARKEKKRLDKLPKKPKSYRFLTTKPLTQRNKSDLLTDLSPYLGAERDIWGQEDIEQVLMRHPHVERQHVKLWIAGAGQLSAQVNAGIWHRSRQLASEIDASLPRYVETGVLGAALKHLEDHRALVVSGPPGVGKTTVARLLVAEAVAQGYEPVEISSDVSEAQQVMDRARKQVFYYDDFLGSTFLSNRLSKNEDKRLASFIREVQLSSTSKFVMTTREYILRQALEDYEELERADVNLSCLIIQVSDYTRVERGRILYNHIFHSPMVGRAQLEELKRHRAYLKVIDHSNYNPRLIEFVSSTDPLLKDSIPTDFVGYVLGILANPAEVWRRPYEAQLDEVSKTLVLLLACAPGQLSVTHVEHLLRSAKDSGHLAALPIDALERSLRLLDDSFVATDRGGPDGHTLLIRLHNASIRDFVASLLQTRRAIRRSLLRAVGFFEQVTWIFANVHKTLPPNDRHEFLDDVSDALLRTFGHPAPRLTNLQSWQRSGDGRFTHVGHVWVKAEVVAHLLELHSIMSSSERCKERLVSGFRTALDEQVSKWSSDPDDFDQDSCMDIVRLLKQLDRQGELKVSVWEAAVALVSGLEASVTKWSLLNDLRELGGVGTEFFDSWRDDFQWWLDGLLDSTVEDVDMEDLDLAKNMASELGVALEKADTTACGKSWK